ncbi:MAG: hypothetical protein Q7R97_03165 [Candidatus Daviesbacteria bacterium]|nr:hypothetical protein [Candidatus Daviesbacteria bacterium]
MKAIDKLKQEQELEERIIKRIQKIKKRKGYYGFLSDINLPEREKKIDKNRIIEYVDLFEVKLPAIKTIVMSIKKNYVLHIWEQDAITAVYLLTAKAYGDLETLILFAKQGRNFEIIELARSGQESLDLAFLFLESEQEERLKDWFKGKIIPNRIAREALHKAVNSENLNSIILPMYELKTYIYSIYSLYTHSSYAALLDTVDVFHEDFDYNGISGFHYTFNNLDIAINNLAISLLLELKNIFTKYQNFESINKVDGLLRQMGNYKASPEEINEIFKRYKNEK